MEPSSKINSPELTRILHRQKPSAVSRAWIQIYKEEKEQVSHVLDSSLGRILVDFNLHRLKRITGDRARYLGRG